MRDPVKAFLENAHDQIQAILADLPDGDARRKDLESLLSLIKGKEPASKPEPAASTKPRKKPTLRDVLELVEEVVEDQAPSTDASTLTTT